MRPKHVGQPKASAERVVKDIGRATRRHFSAEDKIRIVLEGLRGDDSISGLVTVLRRSLISLCHLCFERQRADATQICVTATGVVEPVDVLEDRGLCLSSC